MSPIRKDQGVLGYGDAAVDYGNKAAEELVTTTSRKLPPRCYSYVATVPTRYEDFESQIKKWISTCVMSRTQIHGAPIRRERELIAGNASLRRVWESVKALKGERVSITAEYLWNNFRVEEIQFSTELREIEFEPEIIQVYHSIDVALARARLAIQKLERKGINEYDGISLDHLYCLAETAAQEDFDDRVVWAEKLTARMDAFMRGDLTIDDLVSSFRDHWKRIHPDDDDTLILERLVRLSDSMGQVIDFLRRHVLQTEVHALNPNLMRLRDWIVERSEKEQSVYHCMALE
jgi:hypothetical protein